MELHFPVEPGRPGAGVRATSSFELLALPHLGEAYGLARRLLGDDHDAQDAVQEAFLRAYRHFGAFRGADPDGRGAIAAAGGGGGALRAWLLAIVRNTALTQRRRRARERAPEPLEAASAVPAPGDDPEATLIRSAGRERVRAALARLSPDFREVIQLRELEGLSYREIARAAALPEGTVMSRLARARQQLRRLLLEAGEEP